MRRTRYAKAFHKGHKAGMNKTEQVYEGYLAGLKLAGVIEDFWYEAWSLKIADDTRYTPDFIVLRDGFIEAHEVKAGKMDKAGKFIPLSEDASRIKIRVAAETFPLRFVLACLYKGEWHFKQIGETE